MKGLAFHCHHDTLYEYCYDYDERVRYIKTNKPPEEQELRLKLFQMILEDRLPGKDSPEWKAYDKTLTEYNKARAEYYKTWAEYNKARAEYYKTRAEYDKARAEYYKTRAEYDKTYGKEIELLHKELCPDCPWDGKTIFTRKDEKGDWR